MKSLNSTWLFLAVAGAGGILAGSAALHSQSQSILITLTGQSMIRSDTRATAPTAVPVIQSLIKGDVKFTNFEATVVEPGETAASGVPFLAPPEAIDALTTFGFNMFSTSNNHAYDFNLPGVQNTLKEMDARKVTHAGTGLTLADAAAPAYLKTPKGTVALVAQASGLIAQGGMAGTDKPGVNELRIRMGDQQNEAQAELPPGQPNIPVQEDAQRVLNSIRTAKQHADLVIVYQHNHVFSNRPFMTLFGEGIAERTAPNEWLKKWVHQEVDAGADIIVMHGAPLLHGIEIYKGKPIFYDLGNFMFNVPPTLTTLEEPINWESIVPYVQFQGGKLQSINLQPIFMNNIGQGTPDVHSGLTNNQFLDTRGLPAPATGTRARDILQRVSDLSKPFGTELVTKGDTAEVKLGN